MTPLFSFLDKNEATSHRFSTMIFQLLLVASHFPLTFGFGNVLFQEAPAVQQIFPSRTPDRVEIELPDFTELFSRIQQVSPLARVAIQSANDVTGYTGGFNAIGKLMLLFWLVILQIRTLTFSNPMQRKI